MTYAIGDTLFTKKKHVCGSNAWEVMRTGVDIRIRCKGCGREVMMFKADLDKKVIRVEPLLKSELST
ncbi:MAG: DUF951 domain-containing protein [Acholeplasmataceae bacterium]|nr:DUF951 domain-containing protein [Acholeplasmataceae bacterium]